MEQKRKQAGKRAGLLGMALLAFGMAPVPGPTAGTAPAPCTPDPGPPEYYRIDLVSTKRLPGTRAARGAGYVTFAKSPFGIAVTPEGHYVYDLRVAVERLPPSTQGVYVAWVATPALDVVERLGPLDANGTAKGRVHFNKFLVFITLEPSAEPAARWTGPVVLRGLSKSGFMHTMAGHGPFQQEPCTNYGFN
ncbi:hypothetical protein GQ464_010835 [Rhodocaloribacter litoris]|uniref:hypothetical protein n=1 Tax=Rhodocaloribacter litoris TaxID=2558931 RepID=UPI00141DC133|nr:hypothetical protein [Rhodocaloribacter litoris]QXD13953.1 hypothetical protein GQ464_010835 [Rhodocaloribacter litoris]